MRDDIERKTNAETAQKTAEAAANNAVKLERARGLAIDRIVNMLEKYPEGGGSHVRQSQQKDGKHLTVDYDIADLVSALIKLTSGGNMTEESAAMQKAREILGGVKTVID